MHQQLGISSHDPTSEIVPGVQWGKPEWVPSPAYWAMMAAHFADSDDYICRRNTPLHYELAFCILGGFGIKMEVNQAAWERVHEAGLLEIGRRPKSDEIEDLLRFPLQVGARHIRYRFPKQRAQRLSEALQVIEDSSPPTDSAKSFRHALMQIKGVGPKTASWIARNWLGSEEVAIIDVHVLRAGQRIGLFSSDVKLPRDYDLLEQRFLDFASAIGVRPALLDAIIWRVMRTSTIHGSIP